MAHSSLNFMNFLVLDGIVNDFKVKDFTDPSNIHTPLYIGFIE